MSRTELIVRRPKPSLWQQFRSYMVGPLTTKSPELARYFGAGPTLSGVSVNEQTAMNASAVFSAVSLISDDIASLPLFLYKRIPETGGKDRFETHPLYRLLHDSPNPEMDSMVMRRTMTAHVLIWQNAYAEIERDGAGRPVAIWPLVPERVSPVRDASGTLRYRVSNPSGGDVVINAEDMLHLVGRSHDGSIGSSLVANARESIGLALAAEKFGAAFFGNGSTFGGVISYAGQKPPELADKSYKESLEARHQGVFHAFRLLTLFNGAKFEKVGVAPNEGQFNETRIFQIREVARWFKMPPHKLGDLADATYSNVEQMDAAYYSSCIRPWLVLWEQQLTRKLISPLERRQQFIEHDTHGFLSVDAAARAELYTSEFRVGSLKPDEIRSYENRDPIPGGQEAFVSLDVMPLRLAPKYWELAIEERQAKIESLKNPPPPPPPPPQPDPNTGRAIEALETALAAERAGREQEATEKRQAQQKAEDLSAALAQETGAKDAYLAAEAHVRELLAGAEQALAQEQSDRKLDAGIWEMRVSQMNDSLAVYREERDALRVDLHTATAETAAAVARATALEDEVRRGAAAVEALAAERDGIQGKVDAAIGASEAAIAERDAARAAALLAEAGATAAEQRADAAERDRGIAEHAQQAANETIATLQATIEQERTAHQQTRDGHVARVNGILVAHRALIADVMRRVVQREIERARKHAWNPQKFRAWIDTFYGDKGVEDVAEALLPAVRAHLSILSSQSDPHEMARQLAADHVAESEKQLRDLLFLDDFAPILERTLAQWESSRPEAVADRLLTRGLADVR